MIGKLQGIVDYIGDGFVILLTGGVGYKVYTAEYLTHKSTVELWIETVVREDSIRLFGFTTLNGQNLFNMLTGVSGAAELNEVLSQLFRCGIGGHTHLQPHLYGRAGEFFALFPQCA